MSEKKNGGDSQDGGTESPTIDKPVDKRYPFQTTKRRNNHVKIEPKSAENLIDNNQNEPKNEIEILTPVVNEQIRPDDNLSETVNSTRNQENKDATLQIDPPKREQLDPEVLPQATETLYMKNEMELDPVEVSVKSEMKTKIRRKDLTEKEIEEICKGRDGRRGSYTKARTPGSDPRFQQQNQTMRCFVMYTDFYRCENILGEGEIACQWFKDVFTSICPLDWIRRWDEARAEGRFGWTKGRTQGKFPGSRYGV